MQLTNEQLEAVETFGGLNYTAEKIAMMLSLNGDEFLEEFNMSEVDPGYLPGQVRYHYDLGMLRTMTAIDKANVKRAEEGNLTSIAQFKKDTRYREIQNAKNRTVYQQQKTYIEGLQQKINGEESKLTPLQAQYVDQIEYIRVLNLRMNSKQHIISAVKKKWPSLSRNNISRLYNETLNLFYLDNDTKIEAWKHIFAEKLENLGALAIEMDDIEQARRCFMDAANILGVNKEQPQVIPAALLDRRQIVYTMDIQKLGIPRANKNELAAFIDKLDLTQKEKAKFRREALIEDSPFEITPDDDQD